MQQTQNLLERKTLAGLYNTLEDTCGDVLFVS